MKNIKDYISDNKLELNAKIWRISSIDNNIWKRLKDYKWNTENIILEKDTLISEWIKTPKDITEIIENYLKFVENILSLSPEEIIENLWKNTDLDIWWTTNNIIDINLIINSQKNG